MPNGFSVTISAVDNATKTLDRINKRIDAITKPVRRLQAAAKAFADRSGLSKVGRGFGAVARFAGDALGTVTRMIGPLGAITSAASLAGMYRLVESWGDFGQKLGFAAQRIGISADKLQGLQGAARLAGASAEAMTSGMRTLKDTLTDAVGGRNAEAVVYFNTLGISFRDASGHARNVTDVLPELADKIAALPDPTLQARAATVLLGGAAEELLPFLRKGSAGLREYEEMARRYGVMSDDAAGRANEFKRSQVQLDLAVRGLSQTIGDKLGPVIGPLLTQMADWIGANREWIAQGVSDKVREFADWLKSVDWNAWGTGIKGFAEAAEKAVNAIGGIKAAVELFIGTSIALKLAPWMLALQSMTAGFKGVEAAATAAAVAEDAALAAGGAKAVAAGGKALSLGPRIGAALAGLGTSATTAAVFGGGILGFLGARTSGRDIAEHAAAGERPLMIDPFGNAIGYVEPERPTSAPNGSEPRGIRNNNPLNLSYLPGQGAVRSDGRFGVYRSMDEGVAASERQLLRYQDRGLNSVRQMISTWAPPNENDTASYIAQVSKAAGVDPDAPVNMRDPRIASAIIQAMAKRENGKAIDPAAADRGVRSALGLGDAPPSAAAPREIRVAAAETPASTAREDAAVIGEALARRMIADQTMERFGTGAAALSSDDGKEVAAAAPGGSVTLDITHRNPPPGTTTNVASNGNVQVNGPRVERAMPGGQMP